MAKDINDKIWYILTTPLLEIGDTLLGTEVMVNTYNGNKFDFDHLLLSDEPYIPMLIEKTIENNEDIFDSLNSNDYGWFSGDSPNPSSTHAFYFCIKSTMLMCALKLKLSILNMVPIKQLKINVNQIMTTDELMIEDDDDDEDNECDCWYKITTPLIELAKLDNDRISILVRCIKDNKLEQDFYNFHQFNFNRLLSLIISSNSTIFSKLAGNNDGPIYGLLDGDVSPSSEDFVPISSLYLCIKTCVRKYLVENMSSALTFQSMNAGDIRRIKTYKHFYKGWSPKEFKKGKK